MKMWDISEVDLNDMSTSSKFIERYFIIAHKAMINTIRIAEEKVPERFIVSASNDNNIHLHRLVNGVYIGYFGQKPGWNINDMTPYEKRKPRFVRDWYLKLKAKMKAIRAKRSEEDRILQDVATEAKIGGSKGSSPGKSFKMDAKAMSSMKISQDPSPFASDEEDLYPYGKEQDDYENDLAENMDFSDEEDQEEMGGMTIKNAAQYAAPPLPKKKPKGR